MYRYFGETLNKAVVEEKKCIIELREIFLEAFRCSAVNLVIVHNHPSGTALPSAADIERTRVIRNALKACEMSLVDHVVIGTRNYYSFSDERLTDI